jgi:hypothetical protein
MNSMAHATTAQIPVLLRGEVEPMKHWLAESSPSRVALCVGIVVIGTSSFGAAIGLWRAPTQALYNAIKFPLVILLVSAGNALLNGMLAPLLGLNLRFRQSFVAILMSFTIASAILGAFSPLVVFMIWNTPPRGESSEAYAFLLLGLVIMIAFAGVAANVRLVELLRRLSSSPAVAHKVLAAWLAGNLFLGSQLCWILRPFVGSPGLPVQFLRPNAFQGNFFETVFGALKSLFLQN